MCIYEDYDCYYFIYLFNCFPFPFEVSASFVQHALIFARFILGPVCMQWTPLFACAARVVPLFAACILLHCSPLALLSSSVACDSACDDHAYALDRQTCAFFH